MFWGERCIPDTECLLDVLPFHCHWFSSVIYVAQSRLWDKQFPLQTDIFVLRYWKSTKLGLVVSSMKNNLALVIALPTGFSAGPSVLLVDWSYFLKLNKGAKILVGEFETNNERKNNSCFCDDYHDVVTVTIIIILVSLYRHVKFFMCLWVRMYLCGHYRTYSNNNNTTPSLQLSMQLSLKLSLQLLQVHSWLLFSLR